jgi:hypothetical protein
MKKIKPTKNNKSKIKKTKQNKTKQNKTKKNKTKKLYLLVALAPLTSTETFEIQDYSNVFMLSACILKTNRWDLST